VAKPLAPKKKERLLSAGAEIVEFESNQGIINLSDIFNYLGERQVVSVLVEGGNKLFGYLFDGGLADKVLAFVSPIIIGGQKAKGVVGGIGVDSVAEAKSLHNVKMINFDKDILVSGYIK
jgi:diaminohydroxyphosphoribosylaminopyrimidine deaminase/5-amino-6-(5-phosphoribosylamino)uracil reductase